MRCQRNYWPFWSYIWLIVSVSVECDKYLEEQGVKVRLERVKCKCAPDFCFIKCNVKFISRERADLNIFGTLLKTVNDLQYHGRGFYKHSNNEYRPMLVELKDDFCKSYPTHSSVTPLGLVLNILGKHINFNRPCPWPPGEYYAKDFNLAAKHLPSLFPEGRHMINVTAYSQPNVLILNFETYFQVTNYGILDLRVG